MKIKNEANGSTISFNDITNWHLNNFNSIQAINAVSVIAILDVLNLNILQGMKTISNLKPLPGRGEKVTINFNSNSHSILIDDSYNANPSSMQIALLSFHKSIPSFQNYKSIIIIADMLELGKHSDRMHQNLIPILNKIAPNLIITVGAETKKITEDLNTDIECISYIKSEELLIDLSKIIQPNQYILIKGSNGTGLWKIIKYLKNINNFQGKNNVT